MGSLDQPNPAALRSEILRLTREYSNLVHSANRPGTATGRPAFRPGETVVPYAGRVFGPEEVEAAVGATLDFWLTLGPEGEAFERSLATLLGVKHSLLVNSGSSANLVALSALTSHKLPKEQRVCRGDEVITCAAGFPTTVAPILQVGAIPVFIDNDPVTGNPDCSQLEEAFRPGRTKAVMMAHTLGNPFDLRRVCEFCARHRLWLIEDNCDSLGSFYSVPASQPNQLGLLPAQAAANRTPGTDLLTLPTGAWGDLSTQSFYPPHHLTLGEGGAVNIVRRPPLKTYAESFRDWGRDCWCPSGKDNTCERRFGWTLGELPAGYDHKYIYSHLGYNLKPLDIQAAIGRRQLERFDDFGRARRANWEYLRAGLAGCEEFFDFTLPTHATAWSPAGFAWDDSGCRSDPSWFGFMLLARPGTGLTRTALARWLDERKIGNRMLFGGNLVRQPAFVELRRQDPDAFRVVGDLRGADRIMNDALFLGTYPGLSREMLDFVVDSVKAFVRSR